MDFNEKIFLKTIEVYLPVTFNENWRSLLIGNNMVKFCTMEIVVPWMTDNNFHWMSALGDNNVSFFSGSEHFVTLLLFRSGPVTTAQVILNLLGREALGNENLESLWICCRKKVWIHFLGSHYIFIYIMMDRVSDTESQLY